MSFISVSWHQLAVRIWIYRPASPAQHHSLPQCRAWPASCRLIFCTTSKTRFSNPGSACTKKVQRVWTEKCWAPPVPEGAWSRATDRYVAVKLLLPWHNLVFRERWLIPWFISMTFLKYSKPLWGSIWLGFFTSQRMLIYKYNTQQKSETISCNSCTHSWNNELLILGLLLHINLFLLH